MVHPAVAAKITEYAASYAQKEGLTFLHVRIRPASRTAPVVSGVIATTVGATVDFYGFEYRVTQAVMAVDSRPMQVVGEGVTDV